MIWRGRAACWHRTLTYNLCHVPRNTRGTRLCYGTAHITYWVSKIGGPCVQLSELGRWVKTVRFLAWRTRVRWESERRFRVWYPGRKRRFSFLGRPSKRYISRVIMPTNRTTYRWMCSSRFAQIELLPIALFYVNSEQSIKCYESKSFLRFFFFLHLFENYFPHLFEDYLTTFVTRSAFLIFSEIHFTNILFIL